MTDLNDNSYEAFEEDSQGPEEPQQKPSGNRNFLIAIGVIGGIGVLALIVLILVGLVILPGRNASRKAQAAEINAQNTATSQAATVNAATAIAKQMATATSTNTPLPSPTPVVAIATATEESTSVVVETTPTAETPVLEADLNARTQTLAALLTQSAQERTPVTPTPSTVPTTGFADEVGLPLLAGAAMLLIAIIFFARRMRMSR